MHALGIDFLSSEKRNASGRLGLDRVLGAREVSMAISSSERVFVSDTAM